MYFLTTRFTFSPDIEKTVRFGYPAIPRTGDYIEFEGCFFKVEQSTAIFKVNQSSVTSVPDAPKQIDSGVLFPALINCLLERPV